MKTLQECKDQIAKEYNARADQPYESWEQMVSTLSPQARWRVDNILERADEAAELYARAKWDEACEAQLRHLGLDHMISQPKPEFKP